MCMCCEGSPRGYTLLHIGLRCQYFSTLETQSCSSQTGSYFMSRSTPIVTRFERPNTCFLVRPTQMTQCLQRRHRPTQKLKEVGALKPEVNVSHVRECYKRRRRLAFRVKPPLKHRDISVGVKFSKFSDRTNAYSNCL